MSARTKKHSLHQSHRLMKRLEGLPHKKGSHQYQIQDASVSRIMRQGTQCQLSTNCKAFTKDYMTNLMIDLVDLSTAVSKKKMLKYTDLLVAYRMLTRRRIIHNIPTQKRKVKKGASSSSLEPKVDN